MGRSQTLLRLEPALHESDLALLDTMSRPFREEAERHRVRSTFLVVAVLVAILHWAAYPPLRIALVAAVVAIGSIASSLVARRAKRLEPTPWLCLAPISLIAVTGGVRSPIFPALVFGLAPYLFIVSRKQRTGRWMWMGAAVIGIVTLLPETITGPAFAPPFDTLLTGVSLVIAMVKVGTFMRRSQLTDELVENEIRRLRGDLLHEAQERSRTFEAVAAKVGHELKTPLAAMRVLLDLEQRRATDTTSDERLTRALAEVKRLSAIVNDYLVLAKPVETLEIDTYDLAAVASDVVAMFEPGATCAGIRIATSASSRPLEAHGDRRRVREALMNLVANAIEASAPGHTVHVGIESEDDRVQVIVRDEGKGIPAHLLPRVGTAFFTTREGGTGLGIVLARTIALQHGGRLSFDSVEGRGTTVTFWMPREAEAREVSSIRSVASLERLDGERAAS